jgi:DnaJ-class molecular chaperone
MVKSERKSKRKHKRKPFFKFFKKSKSKPEPEPENTDYEVEFEFESGGKQGSEESFVIEESDDDIEEIEESTTDIFIPDSAIKEFTVFGLDDSASLPEIKKKYRELAKEYHPDNGGDPKEFMKLQKAYKKILKFYDS